jgi:hypothetical protein
LKLETATCRDGTVEAAIEVDGKAYCLRYSAAGLSSDAAADALLAAALLPAMRTGQPLISEAPVSPQLLAALPRIQDVFRSWRQRYPVWGQYQRVAIDAPVRAMPLFHPGRGVAAFFTGGVDSFYTALRHRNEIDALVYVCGFDVAISDVELESRVLDGVRAAADELGIELVVVRTDLRAFSNEFSKWDHYHGAALASVAHLLAASFEKIYLPATQTYAYLAPLGSHPLVDPLWSTEDLEIVHDGCEASRLEKLELIADELAAQHWLRVCWENRGGRYNCGTCEKCLRTMVALDALGMLESFESLPHHIGLLDITRVRFPELRYTWEASLELLERTHRDPAVARAVRRRLYGRSTRAFHRGVYYAHRIRALARK